MNRVFTIGFTKKSARDFFELLRENGVDMIVDVRLNNVSQLAGFTKYPDIQYFLKQVIDADYISDKNFAPEDKTLKSYRDGKIDWNTYLIQFNNTMRIRDIKSYIYSKYAELVKNHNVCFLCSEETPEYCHRRLVAEIFKEVLGTEIIHII